MDTSSHVSEPGLRLWGHDLLLASLFYLNIDKISQYQGFETVKIVANVDGVLISLRIKEKVFCL